MSEKSSGIVFTVASALLFGFTPVLASFTYEMGSNASTLTFYRNLLVVPLLAVWMLAKKIPFSISGKELGAVLGVGILFRATTTYMLYASYDFVGIGAATTLHFLYPVCTALLGRFLFGERLGFRKTAALAAASCGVFFFMEGSGGADPLPGVLLAAASALTYSCYMTGMDKTCLRQMPPTKVACYMGFANAAAMLLMDLPARRIVFFLPPLAMVYTLIIALCTSFGAVALLQLGIRRLGASTAAIFCMFEPLASVLAGALFLGESMGLQKLAGCAIILGAALLVMAEGKKDAPKEEHGAGTWKKESRAVCLAAPRRHRRALLDGKAAPCYDKHNRRRQEE